MHVVIVQFHIKPEYVEAFRAAATENAINSLQEPGVARFDVVQQNDDPTRFVLYEAYRTAEDPVRHKETAHYLKWRDLILPMEATPRITVWYTNVYPDEAGWG